MCLCYWFCNNALKLHTYILKYSPTYLYVYKYISKNIVSATVKRYRAIYANVGVFVITHAFCYSKVAFFFCNTVVT